MEFVLSTYFIRRILRVTKDVLEVGNSILMEAKKCFKDVIEYARPEEAVKDLGTKVCKLTIYAFFVD